MPTAQIPRSELVQRDLRRRADEAAALCGRSLGARAGGRKHVGHVHERADDLSRVLGALNGGKHSRELEGATRVDHRDPVVARVREHLE